MKFAQYDLSGSIVAFYDVNIHNSIPLDSIEITDEQWQDCLANPGKYIVSGGELVLAGEPTLLNLSKKAKRSELANAYYSALSQNYSSSALGVPHDYSSEVLYQVLLNNLIANGATADYVYYSGGTLITANHTLSQLQQVLADLVAFQQAIMTNYSNKLLAVESATTVSDVEAITW